MAGRDLQSRDQGLHLASTMTESSVESFLKGVRSQVEISKVKEEEEEEGAEKEKEGVEEDIQGVAEEEANEMVMPEEDMVTLKEESIGDVTTVKDNDQGAGDANQGGLGGEGEGEQE